MKASNDSSTYLWKPTSKITFIEIIYIIIVVTSMVASICLILIPYTKLDHLFEHYPSVWIGFILQWFGNTGLEIYHIVYVETLPYDPSYRLYGSIRIGMLVGQASFDALCISLVSITVHKCASQPLGKALYCAAITTFSLSLLRQIISQIFFMPVYPIEIISTLGIVALGIVITFKWASLSKILPDHKIMQNNNIIIVKCLDLSLPKFLTYVLNTVVYVLINTFTYLVIMLYITFLNSFQKSPFSLLLQIIFALLPSLSSAIFSRYGLDRWTGDSKKTREAPADTETA